MKQQDHQKQREKQRTDTSKKTTQEQKNKKEFVSLRAVLVNKHSNLQCWCSPFSSLALLVFLLKLC
jgi:hypothetical protein